MSRLRYAYLASASVVLSMTLFGPAFGADQDSADYTIPLDVINAGGKDVSKSSNYLLSDSLGEAIVGTGVSDDYRLDAGYRQPSAAEFHSMNCSAIVAIGSISGTGQRTGSGTCTVYSDAYSGYNLGWSILTGSGGTNTGNLISQYNDVILPFTPGVVNVPEAWSVSATDSEWGGRLRSTSTDTASEWGTDGVSDKWLNVRTTNRSIVVRETATPISGSVEIFQFRSEVGTSKVQPTGTYQTVATFT